MKKSLKLPTFLVYAFLLALLIYFAYIGNYEFIGYAVVVGFLFFFVLKLDKRYHLPPIAIWLFSIWVFLHMLGGSLYLYGTRLYDLILIPILGAPYHILKYDQFVHAFCYFAISIIVFLVLKKHFSKNSTKTLFVFAILAAIGIGLLNEVIEFGMVVFAGAADAVGGYYNTALDLVFNLIGAILGVWYASKKLV